MSTKHKPAACEAAPVLPTPWKTVIDATGEPVQVWRAFQMRDYVRDALALASPRVATAPIREALEIILNYAEATIKTKSRDIADWQDDMQHIVDRASKALATPVQAARQDDQGEQT